MSEEKKKLNCSMIQERIDTYYEEKIRLTAKEMFEEFEEYLNEPYGWKEFSFEIYIPDTHGTIQYAPAILSELKKYFEEDVKLRLMPSMNKIEIRWG